MDPEVREYFLAVEDHYQRTIGRPLILSPKDVEAVRDWWQKGVPLEAARRGITAYLQRLEDNPRKRRRRLAVRYAVNEVMDAAEDLRASRIGDRRGEGVEDEDRIQEVAVGLAEALEQAAAGEALADLEPELLNLLRRRAAEIRELLGEDSEPEVVEERLEAWDGEILEALRRALDQEVVGELRKEAEARLSDMRSRMEEKAWKRTAALLEEKLLRDRYGLPRLSIYGY